MSIFMRVVVAQHERAFFYLDGEFRRMLLPGAHWLFTGLGHGEIKRVSLLLAQVPFPDAEILAHDPEVAREVTTYRIGDTERGLVFHGVNFHGIIGAGFHAFLRSPLDVRVEVVDASDPLITHKLAQAIPRGAGAASHVQVIEVPDGQRAMLYLDNVAERLLEPGRYVFWKDIRAVKVVPVAVRETTQDVQGQELMTQDKVALRVNLSLRTQVTDVVRALASHVNWAEAVYREAQLALRDEVGARSLDDLLARKDDLGNAVAARMRAAAEAMGVAVLGAGLRDVILPGEMRTILNQVIEAEKRAQANMIARREETAATRNLMNTAKLLENNPVLMHLKELESTERIAEKIGNLSIIGGLDGLLDAVKRAARPDGKS